MPCESYPSDLDDKQLALLEPSFREMREAKAPQGRPRTLSYREIVNALMYLTRTGAAWRIMPHDFPPWGLVYHYFHDMEPKRIPGKTQPAPAMPNPGGRRLRPGTVSGHAGQLIEFNVSLLEVKQDVKLKMEYRIRYMLAL